MWTVLPQPLRGSLVQTPEFRNVRDPSSGSTRYFPGADRANQLGGEDPHQRQAGLSPDGLRECALKRTRSPRATKALP